MSSYTLDSIRAAADAKYSHTEIVIDESTTVRLVNPLRLNKEDRAVLLSIQDRFDEDDADQTLIFADAIRAVADDRKAADKLIELIDGDLAVLAQVFSSYTEATSVGEASASAN